MNRSEDTINPAIATGEWELVANELRILSRAATPPLLIEEDIETNEAVRLKYRFLGFTPARYAKEFNAPSQDNENSKRLF